MTAQSVFVEVWNYVLLHWRGLLGWLWLLTGIYMAVRITLQRRAPAATLAWILALCLVPFVGLLVYHVFGPQKIKRQSLRRVRSQALLRSRYDMEKLLVKVPDPPIWALQHSRLIEAGCGIPPSSCSAIEIINGGGATLDALVQHIARAQAHVHLEYYIFDPDQTGQILVDALVAALQRGVKVRLLVDAVGSSDFLRRKGRAMRAQLVDAGGELQVFHPTRLDVWRPMVNLRTHRKIVVCDGMVGFTGGINITDTENEKLFPDTAYRDTHLLLEGAAVRWLQYVFLQDWAYASGQHDFEDTIFPPVQPGRYAAHVVASGPDSSGQAIHHSVLHALGIAQERIWLTTPYFVPTEPTWYALINAAQRGVQVRILLPKKSDSRLVTMAARSHFQALCEAGAEVYEYDGPLLHAKTLVVDDSYSMVGTANFDNRSFLLNFEVAVVLYNPAFNQQLAHMFEHDLRKAEKVKPCATRLVWYKQLSEAVARLMSPLL